jgi:hypothetical protein
MILGALIVVFFLSLAYLLSIQTREPPPRPPPPPKKLVETPMMPLSFVASEAEIVPTHASYSNKFNDVIGNSTSGIAPGSHGVAEVVIPSDWYMFRTPPTEFDGSYWPRGSIEPDFIYPGSDPKRPLRSQNLYASQIVTCAA